MSNESKHTAVCGKEQKRFIRFRSLGEDFTEENLKKVIAGEKEPPERNEKVPDRKEAKPEKCKFDLVVDIQEKMAQGENGGYVRWAKKYNVKQFVESILFLQQHAIHDKETVDAGLSDSEVKCGILLCCSAELGHRGRHEKETAAAEVSIRAIIKNINWWLPSFFIFRQSRNVSALTN